MSTDSSALSQRHAARNERRHRDRRRRVLRPRHGDPAAAGGHRGLRRARARRRRRRHLVGQHLPRLRLRRPVAPLLVLVRAEPGLDARPTRPSRRSAPTCSGVAARATTSTARPARHDGRPRPRGTRTPAAGSVETSGGHRHARACSSPAMGALTEPQHPGPPGLERFEGTVFHSARWDHDHDLTGKRVAVVGTGASAIQFVPAIQPKVAQLHVFQRTRAVGHAAPGPAASATRERRALPRASRALQRLVRGGDLRGRELLVLGFVKHPRLMRSLERIARRHIRAQVARPRAARARSRPDYTIGCKRILPSNDWYPALGKPNVELVTSAIREVREHSIVTEDGTRARGRHDHLRHRLPRRRHAGRQLGPRPRRPHARRGWNGSPRAYLGTAVAGFPNLFLLLGPNTGLGPQLDGLHDRVADQLRARRAAHDARAGRARPPRSRRGAGGLQRASSTRGCEGTVWSTGCASWYLDATGRNATLWPDWTWRFRRRTRRFEPAQFELTPARRSCASAGSRCPHERARAHHRRARRHRARQLTAPAARAATSTARRSRATSARACGVRPRRPPPRPSCRAGPRPCRGSARPR